MSRVRGCLSTGCHRRACGQASEVQGGVAVAPSRETTIVQNHLQELVERLGVEVQTLRRWEESGELVRDQRSAGGTGYYVVAKILGLGNEDMPTIGYPRVASHDRNERVKRIGGSCATSPGSAAAPGRGSATQTQNDPTFGGGGVGGGVGGRSGSPASRTVIARSRC